VDAERSDGVADRCRLLHVQHQRVLLLRRGRGGATIIGAGGDDDDVEALAKADDKATHPGGGPGAAGPAVHGGEVLQERRLHGAREAAALAGAVAWLVRTRPGVAVAVMVRHPLGAAVGGVRARDADRVHHLLHGVAPEVAAGDRDAADMAVGRLPELVVARRAHHVTHRALHMQSTETDYFARLMKLLISITL